jgi:serine/threonine-protein kinase RsbW
MIVYHSTFISEKCNKTAIISSIRKKLRELEGTVDVDDFDLNLILDEAIVNAMEHGNSWDPEKNVTVKIYHNNKDVQILIEDEGSGFNYNDLDSKDLKWQPDSKLNIRGRGIFLLKQLCDIEWINHGNVIKIVLPLKDAI